MAHKKGLGSSRNGRDSRAQRLGVEKALEKAGAVDGDEIRIVGRAFEFESVRTAEDLFKELDL